MPTSPLCGCNEKFGLDATSATCAHAAVVCKGGELVVPKQCFQIAADARFDWAGNQAFVTGGPTAMLFTGYVDTPSTFTNNTCAPMQTMFTVNNDWIAGVSTDQDLAVQQQVLVNGGIWAQNGLALTKGPGGFMSGKNEGFTVAGPLLAAGASMQVQVRTQYQLQGSPNSLTGWLKNNAAVRIWGGNVC